MRSRDLRDHEKRPACPIVDRGARDPERVDVAARERREGDRRPEMASPGDAPVRRVEGIHAVVLGRHDHPAAHPERLAVDRSIQGRCPCRHEAAAEGREAARDAGPCAVAVVHGPVGRRGRRGRGELRRCRRAHAGLDRGGSGRCRRDRWRRRRRRRAASGHDEAQPDGNTGETTSPLHHRMVARHVQVGHRTIGASGSLPGRRPTSGAWLREDQPARRYTRAMVQLSSSEPVGRSMPSHVWAANSGVAGVSRRRNAPGRRYLIMPRG